MTSSPLTPASRWILSAAAALILLRAATACGAANCVANPNLKTPGECLSYVVPVVMSGPGANGAFFRTSVTIISRFGSISGRLVFHPAGQIGTDSDSSLAFTLADGEIRPIPDVLAAIGATGLGSLDVLLSTGPAVQSFDLFVFAEFYNDSNGRAASVDEIVVPIDPSTTFSPNILSLYYEGFVPVPSLEGRRLRLGVRTLDPGRPCLGLMTFQLYDSAKLTAPVASSTQTFPSNYFQQFDPAFLFGVEPQEGQLILVAPNQSVGCPTISYIAIADNVSNAPSIRLIHATTNQSM